MTTCARRVADLDVIDACVCVTVSCHDAVQSPQVFGLSIDIGLVPCQQNSDDVD